MNKKITLTETSRKRTRLKQLFAESFFVRLFIFLADFFYKKIKYSKIAQFLSSQSESRSLYDNSMSRQIISRFWFKPKTRLLIKNKIQYTVENSLFYKLYLKSVNYLLAAKVRIYGTVLFVYGFCAASIGVIKTFVAVFVDEDYFLVAQGLVLLLIGIIFAISKSDMGSMLSGSKFIRFFVEKIIGYKTDKLIRPAVSENTLIPMLVGFLLGISSMFIDPLYVIAGFFALIYLSIVFTTPEFGVFVTLFFVPFFPTMLLCAQILLVFIAYFCKAIRGKRSVRFTNLDIFVVIFAIVLFFGGVVSSSVSTSLPAVCVFVCFMLAYFIVVNLVKTVELLKKLLFGMSVSLFFCAFIGVWQNFFGVADTTWTDVDMFSEIETRVVSTFENPNVFGEYLIMMLPMTLALFLVEKSVEKKGVFTLAFGVGCLALIFTWSRGAWLGFLISMALYLIVVNKRSIALYLLGLAALPFAYPFFPESIRSRIESIGNMADSSTSYRVHIWEATWDMLRDWWTTGIGVGVGAFREIYPSYSLAGIETAPHSHNLFFQIFIELGIVGLIAFFAVIVVAARKCCSYLAHGSQRETKLISSAALVGLVAILAQGLTDHVWYNYRIFLMFWIVLAIMSASIDLSSYEDKRTDDVESYVTGGQNEKAETSI